MKIEEYLRPPKKKGAKAADVLAEADQPDESTDQSNLYTQLAAALGALVSKDRKDCHSSFMYVLRAMPVYQTGRARSAVLRLPPRPPGASNAL